MKKLITLTIVLFSIPVLAAKIKNAKCSDMATVNEKVAPEYMAVYDGYNKAGKKISEEIDMESIVTESKDVNEQCAKNKSAKIDTVRKEIKSANAKSTTAPMPGKVAINPTKANCQEFISLGEETQPIAVFWVAGHGKSGKLKKGEVDEEFLSRPIATLVEECKAQPTASFYDKTKAWLKKSI